MKAWSRIDYRTRRAALTAIFFLTALAPLQAQIVWVGGLGSPINNISDSANWSTPLVGGGSDDVVFDSSSIYTSVYVPSGAAFSDIYFDNGESAAYYFSGDYETSSLLLNSGAGMTGDASATFEYSFELLLSPGAHTFDIGSNSYLTIDSNIYDDTTTASITKEGLGTLSLGSYYSTFTGGVTVNAGTLELGNSSNADGSVIYSGPVGTGGLTLANGTTLTMLEDYSFVLHNNIFLGNSPGSATIDLKDYGELSLYGNITGSAGLNLTGADGYFDLYGDNSGWSGGLNVMTTGESYINIGNSNALGAGPLSITTDNNYNVITFYESTTVNGLSGGYTYSGDGYDGTEIDLNYNVALTINQAGNSQYDGAIYGYYGDGTDGGLIKTGAGTLTVTGPLEYYGPTVINNGALIVDGSNYGYLYYDYLNSGGVTVNSGGTLGVSNSGYVNTTVTVNSGGKLIGDGYVHEAILNAGATLSPGFNSGLGGNRIGSLTLDDLTLGQGSKLEIDVQHDGSGNLSYDEVYVGSPATLTILADAGQPLTLKLISLNSDGLTGALTGGLDDNTIYSLYFLSYNSGITGDLVLGDNVVLDTTEFTGLSPTATFTLDHVNNDFILNFSPVPEPSTYALMVTGLGLSGLAAWRKRRLVASKPC